MSTKIYNGYRFKELYSFLELEKALAPYKKQMKAVENKLYQTKVLNMWLEFYDYASIYGEEKTIEYIKKRIDLDLTSPISWGRVFTRTAFYIEKRIREANNSDLRSFEGYDFSCKIHILPIENKMLFLYYGEYPEFEEVILNIPFIEEYHYQDQTDKPDYISDEDWEIRKKDWDEAIPTYTPNDRGFDYSFAPSLLDFPNKVKMKENPPVIYTKDQRATLMAETFDYGNHDFDYSYYFSKEFIKLRTENKNKIMPKLADFNSYEDIFAVFAS